MDITAAPLEGVYVISPHAIGDERGYFMESFKMDRLKALHINTAFVQDNESLSVQKGTLRGLHYQLPPYEQAKLVRVVTGAIYDVAVDIRKGSATFGQWFGIELNETNKRQLYIPRGFAHGFVTLEPNVIVQYKVDQYYNAAADRGIVWNDPDINIAWPEGPYILSEKDKQHPNLAQSPL